MFENIHTIAFDLDGTVYEGNILMPGARETILKLQKNGYNIIFCTNNSGKTRSHIASKLQHLGIPCNDEQIFSSGWATLEYLRSTKLSDIWVVGTDEFIKEIDKEFSIVDNPELADTLIVGFDPNFDYFRLTQALWAARVCKTMIFCNEDLSYLGNQGKIFPGCGGMTYAISGCSKRKPNMIIGKPSRYMMSLITAELKIKPEQVLVVGDSYDSDIMFAKNSGAVSILISNQEHEDVPSTDKICNIVSFEGILNQFFDIHN